MAESVTLKKIFRDNVNTKFGAGVRTSIFTLEYPEVRMSSFTKGTETWAEGDKVMIEITRNGEYTNYKPMDTQSSSGAASSRLEARIERLEKHVGLEPEEKVAEGQQSDFDDF